MILQYMFMNDDAKKIYDSLISKDGKKMDVIQHSHNDDAGYDIRACLHDVVYANGYKRYDPNANGNDGLIIASGDVIAVPTGIAIHVKGVVEKGTTYEVQVRPRSGNAIKHSISVHNAPGTIDASYTGEVKIILYNAGENPFIIHDGDRIAQLVVNQVYLPEVMEVKEFSKTDRGDNGLGSSGKK